MLTRLTILLLLLGLALPAEARPSEWQMKQRVKQRMVALRAAVTQQLYQLEETNNWLQDNIPDYWHPEWFVKDYAAVVQDAHRLYMDSEVLAAKLGAKPLHPEIVQLRHGHMYCWQHRDSAENDGFCSDLDRQQNGGDQ